MKKQKLLTGFKLQRPHMLSIAGVLVACSLLMYSINAPDQNTQYQQISKHNKQTAAQQDLLRSRQGKTKSEQPQAATTPKPDNSTAKPAAPVTTTTPQPSNKPTASTPAPIKTAAAAAPVAAAIQTPAVPAPASDIATEAQCPGQGNISATTVLVCMTSFARQAHGLSTVSANSALMASSANKAPDIRDCGFSHTACGRDFGYWITTDGYTKGCYAENIAMGQPTPGAVFTAWMNSPGHRANILHDSYRDIGVAELASPNGPIWVMHLGGC